MLDSFFEISLGKPDESFVKIIKLSASIIDSEGKEHSSSSTNNFHLVRLMALSVLLYNSRYSNSGSPIIGL